DTNTEFELKAQFLKELRENPFSGVEDEDANEHAEKVLKIDDMFHVPNVIDDHVMLRVFPKTLTGQATRWLKSEPLKTITIWTILKNKFLTKYCPPSKTARQMEEIHNIKQEVDETLHRA
ncbi:hypothetical protein Tco_0056518, partial [Tanacetum coccineum]